MAKKPSNKKSVNQSKGKGRGKVIKGDGVNKSKTPTKKPSSKKSTPKKINKGLSLYIHTRSILWSKFGKDYNGKDYSTKGSEFLKVSGQVYRECRSRGSECTDEVLIEKYQEIVGGEQRFEPFVDDELYGQAQPYWEINDISWISFEPYLWVISPMIIPSPHEFQVSDYLAVGGDRSKGYAKFFRQWVDFNNEQEKLRRRGSKGDIPHFVLTKPAYNKTKKRWEVFIYIISAGSEQARLDEQGQQLESFEGWETDNYGFIPKGDIEEPIAPKKVTPPSVKKKEEKKKAPTKKKTPTKKAPIKKEAPKETEAQRHRRVSNREKELKVILSEIRENIKLYKEIGEKKRMLDELKELDRVMQQIKNLK